MAATMNAATFMWNNFLDNQNSIKNSTDLTFQGLCIFLKENGLIVEPGTHSNIAFPVAKRLNTLLRHGDLPREEDGAIECWRLRDDLRNKFEYSQYWSDDVSKGKMAGGGGNKKKSILYWSVRTINSLHSSSPRSFRTQSHRSYTAGQCVEYILSYWMCSQFALHHKFRIDSGEDKILAGTDRRYSLQPWIPCIRITKIRKSLIWPNNVLHRSTKSGKCTKIRCIGVDFQLAQRKGLKFYQTRSNAIIFFDTLPACCISKAIVMKADEIIY